ncbi:hypothetical protein F2Q68_00020140 [Brassica cretica]|uniref:Uncharacterized protein n=1 Tax=Brassica cretica TaxID=69181 RepID=A0A8S9FZQ8_BRACR|nr:hypothetical protein F2Q68_00020140 [Brassica cretica]
MGEYEFVTATNQVLYKLVSSNWIPTMNYTSMNQKRLRFVYMLHHNDGFDFGKLVYDQIMAMAGNTTTEKTRCIMFPTLIHQVILFQRNIPPDTLNDEFTGTPKLVVKDIKAGRGSGADSSAASLEEDINHTIAGLKCTLIQQVILFQRIIPPDTLNDEFTGTPKLVVKDIKASRGSGADSSAASLEEDINRTIAGLKAIRVRLRRVDYVQYVPHPAFDEDEEEDGDDEDEEED